MVSLHGRRQAYCNRVTGSVQISRKPHKLQLGKSLVYPIMYFIIKDHLLLEWGEKRVDGNQSSTFQAISPGCLWMFLHIPFTA
jgi:hypothetical protein